MLAATNENMMNGLLRFGKLSNKTLIDFISLRLEVNETNLNDSLYIFLMAVTY